jgi:hypothetical protein
MRHAWERNTYKVLVQETERKNHLVRARPRWEDVIKIGLKGVGWKLMDWIYLTQDRDQCPSFVT